MKVHNGSAEDVGGERKDAANLPYVTEDFWWKAVDDALI
jgi:hypothetical protein